MNPADFRRMQDTERTGTPLSPAELEIASLLRSGAQRAACMFGYQPRDSRQQQRGGKEKEE